MKSFTDLLDDLWADPEPADPAGALEWNRKELARARGARDEARRELREARLDLGRLADERDRAHVLLGVLAQAEDPGPLLAAIRGARQAGAAIADLGFSGDQAPWAVAALADQVAAGEANARIGKRAAAAEPAPAGEHQHVWAVTSDER
jgi:hypothetical protein